MSLKAPLKVLVLAHDLSDTAIHRRVQMLKNGGAYVLIAGFSRAQMPSPTLGDEPNILFGITQNGNFLQRIVAVIFQILFLPRYVRAFQDADIIIARNLEMLAIAVRGKKLAAGRPVIVYEVLDIHRLLLGAGVVGKFLRALEGWLSHAAKALITSSPAFVEQYFHKISGVRLPVHLVENKILVETRSSDAAALKPSLLAVPTADAPWIIGWFGILRCKKSLTLLHNLVCQSQGRVKVILRGRPALDQIPEFFQVVNAHPDLTFLGPYRNPDDLAEIYGQVHFSWAIDMYEEGQNSAWLLPNRLYEGGYFEAVPLVIADLETGLFTKDLGIGVRLSLPLDQGLKDFFEHLTQQSYQDLHALSSAIPAAKWAYDTNDCRDFVQYLEELV